MRHVRTHANGNGDLGLVHVSREDGSGNEELEDKTDEEDLDISEEVGSLDEDPTIPELFLVCLVLELFVSGTIFSAYQAWLSIAISMRPNMTLQLGNA